MPQTKGEIYRSFMSEEKENSSWYTVFERAELCKTIEVKLMQWGYGTEYGACHHYFWL